MLPTYWLKAILISAWRDGIPVRLMSASCISLSQFAMYDLHEDSQTFFLCCHSLRDHFRPNSLVRRDQADSQGWLQSLDCLAMAIFSILRVGKPLPETVACLFGSNARRVMSERKYETTSTLRRADKI